MKSRVPSDEECVDSERLHVARLCEECTARMSARLCICSARSRMSELSIESDLIHLMNLYRYTRLQSGGERQVSLLLGNTYAAEITEIDDAI